MILVILFEYRNHSITYSVKNVSTFLNSHEDVEFDSDIYKAFGINWFLNVTISTAEEKRETFKYVEIYLYAYNNTIE